MNLNDPLLQALLQSMMAQGAAQQQGITPALQQGAMPTMGGPMTTVGLNQPLTVSPERAATLSPLELQLSNAANMRSFAQPDADRLGFEKQTLGFLDAINQQNTGVYDRRMAAQYAAEQEALNREHELKKLTAPKLIDLEIEKLKMAANDKKELAKTYLEGSKSILSSESANKGQELAAYKQLYDSLKAEQQPVIDPAKALFAEIDKRRKAGVLDEEIEAGIRIESAENPQFKDAGDRAIEYLNMSKLPSQRPHRNTPYNPSTATSKTAQPKLPEPITPTSISGTANKIKNAMSPAINTMTKPRSKEEIVSVVQPFLNDLKQKKGWSDEKMTDMFEVLIEFLNSTILRPVEF